MSARIGPAGIGRSSVPLGTYYTVLVLLLYLPLAVLLLFSLSKGGALSFPIGQLSIDSYASVLASDALLSSARSSLLVALGSSTAATALGTMVAILLLRFRFVGQRALIALAILPLIVPFVVLGVALLVLFRAVGLSLSLWTVGVAHSVVAIPFVLLIVAARLNGVDPRLEDAAMDLGATYPVTLLRVVLPVIAPALVSAWLTAFTVSFDEFALALFLAGPSPTFPVYLYSQLRFASRFPILIAMAVLLMVGTLVLVLAAERIRRLRT
jgi:spermidine/putrescine transport system permease protein